MKFIFLFLCCLSRASYDRLLVGKIIHVQAVFSESKQFLHVFRIKSPTKRIFQIFFRFGKLTE